MQLCEQLGDRGLLFGSLAGLCSSCVMSGELTKAHQVARRNLSLGEQSRQPRMLSVAHMSLAQVLHTKGELAAAQDHFEKGVSLAEAESQSEGLGARGFPIYLSLMAQNQWLLGYPDRALAAAKQVITLARSERNEWWGWVARWSALLVLLWRRDSQALDDANELLTFVTERGFSIGPSQITVGAALIDRGCLAEGIAQIEQAELEYLRFKLHREGRGEHELIEASALGKAGRIADGLQLVVDVLRRKGETGAKVFEAEFQRLLGDLLLAGHNTDTAEAGRAFRTAIEVARQQGAKSSELRATTSLARLLAKQGNATRRARCWRRSTAGSPRASTPPT